jgi:S-adenosylmethionine decarboxylase
MAAGNSTFCRPEPRGFPNSLSANRTTLFLSRQISVRGSPLVESDMTKKATKPALYEVPALPESNGADEHFICKDGVRYAGMHLIIDLWGGKHLDNLALVKQTLTDAVSEIGATLLNIDLHHFEPNGGISGVAVLAESHMSIHTWPEKGYAALDVFVCGDCQPQKAIPVLRRAFLPDNIQCTEMKRGLIL